MEIICKSDVGKPSVQEIDDFETENNIKLPEAYRRFLTEYNGGKPLPDVIARTYI